MTEPDAGAAALGLRPTLGLGLVSGVLATPPVLSALFWFGHPWLTVPVVLRDAIRNTDRTTGTRLGYEVTRRHGAQGLPDGTIDIRLSGTAGQSFGAFLPRGSLRGEAAPRLRSKTSP